MDIELERARARLREEKKSSPFSNIDRDDIVKLKNQVVKVTERVLVFDDTVFPIENISVIAFADLTKRHVKVRTMPQWYWLVLVTGILTIFIEIGIFIIIVFVFLLGNHYMNRVRVEVDEEYGVLIETNSAYRQVLLTTTRDIAIQAVVELVAAINSDRAETKNISLDTYTYNIVEGSKNVNFNTGIMQDSVVNNID